MMPSRKETLSALTTPLARAIESNDELAYAIKLLQDRGKELRRHTTAAHETLSRQFLQQRHLIFGEMPGPWPVEFAAPLEVWHSKGGYHWSTHKTWAKKWTAQISKARFVKLGRRELARYVELDVAVYEIIPMSEQAEYGFKADERVAVYCTLRSLITARPQWVMDVASRVRIARARTLAAQAANTGVTK